MITSRRTWEEKTKQLEEMLEDDLKDTVPYLRQGLSLLNSKIGSQSPLM
jgi:hypothetical protein